MKVLYGLGNIKKIKNSVFVLGIFDGVHLGHQFIINEAVKYAKRIKGKSIEMAFRV